MKDSAAQSANSLKNAAAQQEAQARLGGALRIGRTLGEAVTAERRGEISLDQLDATFQQGLEAFAQEQARFNDVVQREGLGGFGFDTGKLDRTFDSLTATSDAIAKRLDNLAAAAPTPSQTPVPAGGPPPPINIQADVRGVVNNEVIDEIVDKVRRELRKETGGNF